MKIRHRTHPPKRSLTSFDGYMGDRLRAYRHKRKLKNKIAYKSKIYNLRHGNFGGKQ